MLIFIVTLRERSSNAQDWWRFRSERYKDCIVYWCGNILSIKSN